MIMSESKMLDFDKEFDKTESVKREEENKLVDQCCDKIREIAEQIPLARRHEALLPVLMAASGQINLSPKDLDGFMKYALREFDFATPNWREDRYQSLIYADMLNILKVFSLQGHSGYSAAYLIPRVERLMRFEPLAPLTFDDSEFNEINGMSSQNKRLSSVFRDTDGKFTYNHATTKEETYTLNMKDGDVLSVDSPKTHWMGGFPIVLMNDGTFAKVTRVCIKDTATFDFRKCHIVKSVGVNTEGYWEYFTCESQMRKVMEDYEVVYEVIPNMDWKDVTHDVQDYEKSLKLFGDFRKLVETVRPYVEKLDK